jgi:hypothetical protein
LGKLLDNSVLRSLRGRPFLVVLQVAEVLVQNLELISREKEESRTGREAIFTRTER